MAAGANNIYQGQYRAERRLDVDFGSLWAKMGVETKDDSVRAVLRAVTQMLVDDVRKTVDDADVNQPLLDRTEYGDFCRVVKEVLEKYLAAEESGMTAMTDAARKKIVSAIEGEFSGLLDKLLGDSGDKSDIRKGMSGILDDFFRKTRKDRKPGVQEADPTGGVLRKFAERLKTAKTGASGVKPFQDAKGTAEYKTFEKTCQKILRGYQNSIQAEASGDEKAKRKPSLIQRMLKPVLAVRRRYRKIAKVVSAFNKATLIPSIGTMTERFMKTSLFRNANELTKIAVMNYEKFGARAKELLNAFTGQFGLLFWAIGKALQPFKWFVSTTWNAVMHPIDTLKKLIGANWLVGLLKRGFDNPANAFMFGALAAMVYNFVERYVFPVVDHYVIIPALRVVRNVMKWLDPDSPGTVAHAIMGFVDLVKHPIEFLRDLVKPVDGVGNSLVLKVFMNLAKKVGVDFPLSFAKLLFKNADVMLKTMVDLKTSPFLTGFAGSARMSWLLKPMLFAATAAGNALGKIYKTDGDQDGRLSFSERITKALGISKAKVTNAVVGKFMKAGMSAKELEAARGNIDALDGELNALLALDEAVQRLSGQDLEAITGEVKAQFTESKVFGRELLENVLDQISKEMYGGKFDLLGKEQQLVVLRAMLELRRKKADALYELYKSDDVEKNRVAHEILKVPVELSVIPTEPPAAAFSQTIDVKSTFGTLQGPHNGSPAMNIVQMNFSTEGEFGRSMRVLQAGIDSTSELAKFLVGQKVGHQLESNGKIVKFGDTSEARGAIRKYIVHMASRANEATKRKVVQNAFARGMAKLQHGGAVFGLETPRSRYEQEVVRSQVADIMQSQRTDVEKMQELKKLVGGKFEASEKLQENLMAVIDGAFRGPDGAILINSGEREIGDLEGGR